MSIDANTPAPTYGTYSMYRTCPYKLNGGDAVRGACAKTGEGGRAGKVTLRGQNSAAVKRIEFPRSKNREIFAVWDAYKPAT